MSNQREKLIAISQRVPIAVLDNAIIYHLRNDLQIIEEVKRDLSEYFVGKDSSAKAFSGVKKLIWENPIRPLLEEYLPIDLYLKLNENDKKALHTALIIAAFPFAYQLLSLFGKTFKVQDKINRESVMTQISSLYGNNRATYNGVFAISSMFLELELFNHPKQLIYEKKSDTYNIYNPIVSEILLSAILINTNYKILNLAEINYTPMSVFFQLNNIKYNWLKIENGNIMNAK